jgi:hypothetical protein
MILCNREDNMTNGHKNDHINFPALSVWATRKHTLRLTSLMPREIIHIKGHFYRWLLHHLLFTSRPYGIKYARFINTWCARRRRRAAAARAATDGKRSYISMARGGDLRLRQSHFPRRCPRCFYYVHAII